MAQQKNALREHYVADYDPENPNTIPEPAAFFPLASGVTTIEDDSDENTDDYGDYAGDGNPGSTLTSYAEKWNFEGRYDPSDKAQALIAGKKRTPTDDGRRLWHLIKQTDGVTVLGVAKALEIKAGSGDATDYQEFSGHLDYDETPRDAVMTGDKKQGVLSVGWKDDSKPADVPVESVSFSKTEDTVQVGKTIKSVAAVKPDNATDKAVIYTSSDTKLATVDADGTVTGVAPGTATITAITHADSSKTGTMKVVVTAAE